MQPKSMATRRFRYRDARRSITGLFLVNNRCLTRIFPAASAAGEAVPLTLSHYKQLYGSHAHVTAFHILVVDAICGNGRERKKRCGAVPTDEVDFATRARYATTP